MSSWNEHEAISEIVEGVFFVRGPASNWVIVKNETGATVVDTGYPGDRAHLLDSLSATHTALREVRAILVTHAHSDHSGNAEWLRNASGAPVLTSARELPHLRREELHQVNVKTALPYLWRPRVARWAWHAYTAGGMGDVAVMEASEAIVGERLSIPGSPVPLLTPGHTPGHVSYHFPDLGVIAIGDAFVTSHPVATVPGPQMLHPMFHSDLAQARQSLRAFSGIGAEVFLPGHGPAVRMTGEEVAGAVADFR